MLERYNQSNTLYWPDFIFPLSRMKKLFETMREIKDYETLSSKKKDELTIALKWQDKSIMDKEVIQKKLATIEHLKSEMTSITEEHNQLELKVFELKEADLWKKQDYRKLCKRIGIEYINA